MTEAADKIRKVYADQGMRAICYGMGDGLDEVRNASLAAKNVVVSSGSIKSSAGICKRSSEHHMRFVYRLASDNLCPESELSRKEDPRSYSSR